jgi:B9 domain-containing protein 2
MAEPELHLVGQITSGRFQQSNAFIAYHLTCGNGWTCVGGEEKGQTHVDYPSTTMTSSTISIWSPLIACFNLWAYLTSSSPSFSTSTSCVWNHPLDLHYYSRSLQGWPQIVFHAYTLNDFGAKQIIGYGMANIPNISGRHTLTIPMWRPIGPHTAEMKALFLSSSTTLADLDSINKIEKAKEDRCHLWTEGVGDVAVDIDVVMRGWDQYFLNK